MTRDKKTQLKKKAAEEMQLLLVIFLYLFVFFGAFHAYRALILREVGINYFRYGYALLEALVIAKVILLGEAMGLSKKVTGGRLIFSALRLAVVYAVLVAIFEVLEHVIEGLVHGKTLVASLDQLLSLDINELLGKTIVIFIAFIPFFAFWEVGRALGGEKMAELIFRKGGVLAKD
jgi:hypothetical protein